MNKFTQKTSGQEQAIRHFLRDYLNKPITGQMPHSILSDIGRYYDADRSYIFELNEDCTKAGCTCHWCSDRTSAEIENLPDLSAKELACWFGEFEEKGEFFISSGAEDYAPGTRAYQILESSQS